MSSSPSSGAPSTPVLHKRVESILKGSADSRKRANSRLSESDASESSAAGTPPGTPQSATGSPTMGGKRVSMNSMVSVISADDPGEVNSEHEKEALNDSEYGPNGCTLVRNGSWLAPDDVDLGDVQDGDLDMGDSMDAESLGAIAVEEVDTDFDQVKSEGPSGGGGCIMQ